MATNKTTETKKSVTAFLDSVNDKKKKEDSKKLVSMMEKITGEKAKMWGSSIIGFGKYRYRYASGRTGEFLRVGFSPRKQNLTIYIMPGYQNYQEILSDLGPHKLGKSCLYIKSLDDINENVLKKLIKQGFDDIGTKLEVKKIPKIDLKKENKDIYTATKKPKIVNVKEQKIISIEGIGDPNTSTEYKNAIEALYPVAFNMKFIAKKELQKDWVIAPLEGLWWMDNMKDFTVENKNQWKWKMFIAQPDFVTKKLFNKTIKKVREKKNPVALEKIRFEKIHEKSVAQVLHIGSYKSEAPVIQELHEFIKNNNGKLSQKHHEIYISDPRRTAENKLKTIIRQPFTKK